MLSVCVSGLAAVCTRFWVFEFAVSPKIAMILA